mmetsp:Transcript_2660/g.6264  ORF Transcript_2660/g.6264 Transcript_2660/m.6264 type:complete len:204 (-) Transcript_2660:1462-2073(-)
MWHCVAKACLSSSSRSGISGVRQVQSKARRRWTRCSSSRCSLSVRVSDIDVFLCENRVRLLKVTGMIVLTCPGRSSASLTEVNCPCTFCTSPPWVSWPETCTTALGNGSDDEKGRGSSLGNRKSINLLHSSSSFILNMSTTSNWCEALACTKNWVTSSKYWSMFSGMSSRSSRSLFCSSQRDTDFFHASSSRVVTMNFDVGLS